MQAEAPGWGRGLLGGQQGRAEGRAEPGEDFLATGRLSTSMGSRWRLLSLSLLPLKQNGLKAGPHGGSRVCHHLCCLKKTMHNLNVESYVLFGGQN